MAGKPGMKRRTHGPKLVHFTAINLDEALNEAVMAECVKRDDSISNTLRNILREYFGLPVVAPMRKTKKPALLKKQQFAERIGRGE